MKKLKKLLSIVLAVAMVMSLAVSVTAGDYTITIKNSTEGYTYIAYQIFSGDYSSTSSPDTETLSNIAWGDDVDLTSYTEDTILAALKTVTITYQGSDVSPFASVTSAEDVAEALAKYADSTEIANAFAKVMQTYVTGGTTLTQDSTNNNYYSASDLDAGYYLIINTGVPSGTQSTAVSAYMVQVVGNTEIDPKDSVPTLTKTVADVNDSTGSTAQDDDASADYDIGDKVPFTLTATLDSYYEKYSTYKLVFHDTLSDGLTFDSTTVKVSVYTPFTAESGDIAGNSTYSLNTTDGTFSQVTSGEALTENTTYYTMTVVDTGYSIETSGSANYTSGHTCDFELYIADTNSLYASGASTPITVTSGSIITVYYEATLNTNATFSNTNEAYLEYSDDPNSDSEGVSQTSLTYVYDYSLTITKTDGTYALDGAVFTLYKKVYLASASDADPNTTYYANAGDTTSTTVSDAGYYYVAYTATVTGSGNSTASGTASADTFTFTGLDDGEYVLVESTTPSGYNTMENVTFYIIATHDGDELKTLIAGSSGSATENMTDWNTSVTNNEGKITTTIKNSSGSNLPETGGIGVTIFYVVGGILVLAAAGVIVISRKKIKK